LEDAGSQTLLRNKGHTRAKHKSKGGTHMKLWTNIGLASLLALALMPTNAAA
jgi:hypothetical protein